MKKLEIQDHPVCNTAQSCAHASGKNVTFEMVRSFVELGKSLNVSWTADQLGLTRQTVKRHIRALELARNKPLFSIENKQYALTEEGKREMMTGERLLKQLDLWTNGKTTSKTGLRLVQSSGEENGFWSQQYPVQQVFNLAPPLLQKGIKAWSDAQTGLEDPKFRKVRPYLMVYRRLAEDWICVEVGEKSSFATWFGWTRAKSAIGTSLENNPDLSRMDVYLREAYDAVSLSGCAWYDHVHARIPRENENEPKFANYQRLVLALLFPNGEQAIGSLVVRTNNISIEGLKLDVRNNMSKQDVMSEDI